MNTINYYFNRWKTKVIVNKQFREYDEWCEINNDKLLEIQYGMDICWN